ncbi:hypothetical protein [Piscinibacter sakaiensis]|uniref:hypothetical protein n=1 Tax=Piscinibacter sakaiensis TaxID=1547922 RepID=UPI003AAD7D5C
MTLLGLSGWKPVLTPFVIWFVHFMASWSAVEIWPHQWQANLLAWGFTALALLALAVHWRQLARSVPDGELARWTHRFGQGAVAIAAVAVVFSALPSLVFLP